MPNCEPFRQKVLTISLLVQVKCQLDDFSRLCLTAPRAFQIEEGGFDPGVDILFVGKMKFLIYGVYVGLNRLAGQVQQLGYCSVAIALSQEFQNLLMSGVQSRQC